MRRAGPDTGPADHAGVDQYEWLDRSAILHAEPRGVGRQAMSASAHPTIELSLEAEEFARDLAALEPAQLQCLGRLIHAVADEQQQDSRPLSARIRALVHAEAGREDVERLLAEFASQ